MPDLADYLVAALLGALVGGTELISRYRDAPPVSAIFENLEAGANIDDIMEWFDGLDREQVKAVIEFAARSLDRTPVYAP